MTDPDIKQEVEELGQLVEWHDIIKKQNDKAEKQRFVMPNRRDKRAAKRKKAKG